MMSQAFAMPADSAGTAPGLEYSATVNALASSGEFAPYMIGSWNYGRTVAKNQIALDLEAHRELDLSRRFSWGAGAEVITGYSHKASYQLYDAESQTWTSRSTGPAPIFFD